MDLPPIAPQTHHPLIINGDDFGYSSAVNRAIIQAHQQGVLTSTSLMVNERAADEAVQLARATPSLAVGLHLVLVLGPATLPATRIPHLVNADGKFTNSPFVAGMKYFFSPAARRELRAEMRAQFEKFAAMGLPFSHVDGHTHLHMHPVIFDELIQLCEEFKVKRIRVVKGELRLSLRLDHSQLPIQLVNGIVFNLLAQRCENKLRGRGFVVPEKVYGLLQTGNLNEAYLLNLIPQMAHTTSEIYAHPLAPDAEEWNARENPRGAVELQALLSPRLREAIHEAGFKLTTYRNQENDFPN